MELRADSTSAAAARFIASHAGRACSPEVLETARMCLVDWCGVALGAHQEPAARAVRRVAEGWRSSGRAPLLLGGRTTPALAALVNGTMAHCLDFDDTHGTSLVHLSGPTWAATLALAAEAGRSGAEALAAFIAGFELGGRLGGAGFGEALLERGFHPTGVVGRLAAAAAGCAVLGLDADRTAHALGLAATQAAGLTGSFGTMSKPFHAGKAALDGVLSAQLAAQGFEAAPAALDEPRGLAGTFIQDRSFELKTPEFTPGRELLRNTFKPYASCKLTHAAIDAARSLAGQVDAEQVRQVRVRVHPLGPQVAGKPAPRTPLEGKFSLAYCVALGLRGHRLAAGDFAPERLADPAVRALMARVALTGDSRLSAAAATLEVELAGGRVLHAEVRSALGNPDHPMGWPEMEGKFMALVEPVLGDRAAPLLAALRRIDAPGALEQAFALAARPQG
ncbi:MAG: MmgE/PrpD family protein [Candidatus Lambdaproteobacteria bacterium]|nr:MmgE/PrpD family protein [Candidatus Lambdaproteobacteria bacterium]